MYFYSGRLEELLMNFTKQDILDLTKEYDVKFVRLQFIDILGIAKNVAISVEQLDKALDGNIMFDGSSINGLKSIESSDMYLQPDFDTFIILPWRPNKGRVARLICDIYTPEKTPFGGCPRNNLKRILQEASDMGYTMNAGAEAEFFLFLTDEKGAPTTITHDKAGYFDMSPIDLGEDARREMVLALEKIGFEVESAHHEVEEGQHEIRFKYSDALDMADKIITFRTVIKIIAKQYGLHATFMPKPVTGIDGSGMHTHQSLFQRETNVFWDSNEPLQLSKVAMYYLAGLLHHAKAITAITNPTINSYKRLVPGYEAPVYITWSTRNRSALIRIPEKRGLSTRLELRSPDPICNPYLALAVMLKAGLNGINNKMQPPEPVMNNIFEMTQIERNQAGIESLPSSLDEALDCLKQDPIIKDALGDHIVQHFMRIKTEEWNQYRTVVHQWERDQYLYNY